ncbi:sensor histidine kinase [Actinomadura hibisca]|uniref:sensor histidine kinase n=1 Tax=Actinomadura hibisca TaxID=68565 RepID=UPI000836CCED|nr:histidine kinase [Actinomadura hibisca]
MIRPVERRRPEIALDRIGGDGPEPAGFSLWLAVLGWPVADLLHGRSHPVAACVAALVLFAVLYLATVWTAFDARVPFRVPVALLAALTAAAAALAWWQEWDALFVMAGIAAGTVAGHARQRGRGPEAPLLLIIGGVSLATVLTLWARGAEGDTILGIGYGTATAALVTAVVLRLFAVIGLLRAAREELAEAAVTRERLRFSRDLHDLLGHTLSLMVVKAQAVRIIAARDPETAARQAADIETVGRQALGEVRQAVAGYRGRGLDAELEAARTALADAGIEPVIRRSGPPPPPEQDMPLGWAVREGVTNVIRHSGARTCTITLRAGGGGAVLEVRDDGAAAPPPSPGHGLHGLTERMAEAGGTLEAGPAPGGGFVLTAALGPGQ